MVFTACSKAQGPQLNGRTTLFGRAARGNTEANEMTELWQLSASEIADKIDAGETTCEAVTAACLERIEEREPQVDGYI